MTKYPRISGLDVGCEISYLYDRYTTCGKHDPVIEQDIYDVEMTRLNGLLEETGLLVEYIRTFNYQGLFDDNSVMRYPTLLDKRIDMYLERLIMSPCPVCVAAESVLHRPIQYRCCVAWKECAYIVVKIRVQKHYVTLLRKSLFDYNTMMNTVPIVVRRSAEFMTHIRTTISKVEKRHWHYIYKRANRLKRLWMRCHR